MASVWGVVVLLLVVVVAAGWRAVHVPRMVVVVVVLVVVVVVVVARRVVEVGFTPAPSWENRCRVGTVLRHTPRPTLATVHSVVVVAPPALEPAPCHWRAALLRTVAWT